MHFKLAIECSNDAFADSPAAEVARILRDAASRLDLVGVDHTLILRDVNGNRVGSAAFRGKPNG